MKKLKKEMKKFINYNKNNKKVFKLQLIQKRKNNLNNSQYKIYKKNIIKLILI